MSTKTRTAHGRDVARMDAIAHALANPSTPTRTRAAREVAPSPAVRPAVPFSAASQGHPRDGGDSFVQN